jgi:lysophospholipase L1-like esterase
MDFVGDSFILIRENLRTPWLRIRIWVVAPFVNALEHKKSSEIALRLNRYQAAMNNALRLQYVPLNFGESMIKAQVHLTILCGLVLFGVVYGGCDTPSRTENKNNTDDHETEIPIPVVPDDDPAVVPVQRNDPWWQARHLEIVSKLENNPDLEILVVGASWVHYWETNEGQGSWNRLKTIYNIENLGFGGDQTGHLLWRLTNGEFPDFIHPKYVILSIGNNNSAQGQRPESIAAGIGKIVNIIHEQSPQAKIILLSNIPRGDDPNNAIRINNNAVENIIKFYDGYLNIKYYDIGRYFSYPDGQIIESLFLEDHLHLTADGYALLTDLILHLLQNYKEVLE